MLKKKSFLPRIRPRLPKLKAIPILDTPDGEIPRPTNFGRSKRESFVSVGIGNCPLATDKPIELRECANIAKTLTLLILT